MLLNRLYIHNFACYDRAFIDLTQFSTALIVGQHDHDDNKSNGVGKTTIFKAIEYVLFNHSDVNLEHIIRDEQNSCSITVDFTVANQEYRLTRTRTRKGTTDTTLYKRTANIGSDNEVLHSLQCAPLHSKQYWEDISGRRAADTEKEIAKLIKINIKSFRIFVHFLQHDFSGLTTATPEKRKLILRDALNLMMYGKLEKLAKDKLTSLNKEAEKISAMIEVMKNPEQDIQSYIKELQLTNQNISLTQDQLAQKQQAYSIKQNNINELQTIYTTLEQKFASSLAQQKTLNITHNKLQASIQEYSEKKKNTVSLANKINASLNKDKETLMTLQQLTYQDIETFQQSLISNKEHIAELNLTIKNATIRSNELNQPLPEGSTCVSCHQIISPQHRQQCQENMARELQQCQTTIKESHRHIKQLNQECATLQAQLQHLTASKQQLELLANKITHNKKELDDKKQQYNEQQTFINQLTSQLSEVDQQLQTVAQALQQSSLAEANRISNDIKQQHNELGTLNQQIVEHQQDISKLQNCAAILQHQISQRETDVHQKKEQQQQLQAIEAQTSILPLVVQGFSSAGIPALIIQNVLDDLQNEANTLLGQLKPGIQLEFLVEKTQGNGVETDTLDIHYYVHGKKRYYEQLSGGMKLAVAFSLKLGLSFLLQKMAGISVKFLLLDEIDQSLDNASVDTFAEIIRFFQKDFTIMVITHNARLKEKFAHSILVQQDINSVSTAALITAN